MADGMTTSTWLPLLVAALGIVGSVGGTATGVVLSQRNATRQDAVTWARERERERERWAREDANRTFADRRDAYIQFADSLHEMTTLIYNFGTGQTHGPAKTADGRLPPDFQLVTFRKLQRLRLYATPRTARQADEAYMLAWRWGNRTRFSRAEEDFYEDQSAFDGAEESLREAIRTDLGIPDASVSWQWGVIDPTTGEVLDESFLE
jgi:hypothetical protein